MRGKIDALSTIADNAEKNGAIKCAPRELALARSHIEFAKNELDQGQYGNAVDHVDIADPNAHAAFANSPPEKCAPRGFITPRIGDRDGDGIPDNVDKCPDQPENYNGFEDEDGCPDDPDSDGDGIPDSKDQCIIEPEDKDGYQDEDGCPDPDNDPDGIPDSADKCPNKPEDSTASRTPTAAPTPTTTATRWPTWTTSARTPQARRAGTGRAARRRTCSSWSRPRRSGSRSKSSSSSTSPSSRGTCRSRSSTQIVQILKDNPKITLEVQGHTDNVGSATYNEKLSQGRADSVRAYLVAHGIDPARAVSKGYGLSKPLVPNNSEANRALNRRVQFIRTESAGASSSTQP